MNRGKFKFSERGLVGEAACILPFIDKAFVIVSELCKSTMGVNYSNIQSIQGNYTEWLCKLYFRFEISFVDIYLALQISINKHGECHTYFIHQVGPGNPGVLFLVSEV